MTQTNQPGRDVETPSNQAHTENAVTSFACLRDKTVAHWLQNLPIDFGEFAASSEIMKPRKPVEAAHECVIDDS
jgi:hypothetical protein